MADDELTPPSPSPPPLLSPPPPPLPSNVNTTITKGKDNKASPIVVIIVVPVVAFMLLTISICIFLRVRKSKKKPERGTYSTPKAQDEIGNVESLHYDFNTIRVATNNFSDANKLGRGGFGVVYKGTLTSGEDIAVKRLSRDSGQGDLEFKNEVLLVAKLQHRNLVRLLGFCLQGNEKLLIYEFVPNTSLDHFIFDSMKRDQLDWERRYKIIGGIAHFGMARLFQMDQTQGDTSRIVGTYGYMAPEYAMHGQFSVKSDVFSFGVLILELISGQKNTCFRNGGSVEDLLSCAWKYWRDGTALNLDHNSRETDVSQSKSEVKPLSVNEASITELYPR
ncbi:hypothetical protein Q3G72_000137 [Acer saccharum]|nr:hypothetical protein Q3G72_000137 [Acer saccharum]